MLFPPWSYRNRDEAKRNPAGIAPALRRSIRSAISSRISACGVPVKSCPGDRIGTELLIVAAGPRLPPPDLGGEARTAAATAPSSTPVRISRRR